MKKPDTKNKTALILIVDDEQKNLQILGTVLMETGYSIIGANDGHSTLKMLEKTVPDLILLDIMMPHMNGYETCIKIKKDKRFKEIPIIFLTAKVEPEDIVKGFESGGVDYITKPFNHAELLARVSTHLELKRSKEKLRENEAELQTLNSAKDKFFTIIAHDLKSPFNAILNFSELLLHNFDSYDTEKQKEMIGFISQSSQNTYKLLENLLLWSRSQRGILDFNPKEINLYNITNETVECLSHILISKTINLRNEIPEDIFVRADKEMLFTVLRNLISNALKYTHPDGKIILNADKLPDNNGNSCVEISIEDTGVGMTKDKLEKLFRLSETISTKGTANEKGTGLGLILCYEFIQKHGGTIYAESEENKGSKFVFTIPE